MKYLSWLNMNLHYIFFHGCTQYYCSTFLLRDESHHDLCLSYKLQQPTTAHCPQQYNQPINKFLLTLNLTWVTTEKKNESTI